MFSLHEKSIKTIFLTELIKNSIEFPILSNIKKIIFNKFECSFIKIFIWNLKSYDFH